MDTNKLIAVWQTYDAKLQDTQKLNQQLIGSMIRERSRGRIARILNQYVVSGFFIFFWILVSVAVLTGNPFDYSRPLEYIPVAALAVCLVVLLFLLVNGYANLKKINLHTTSVATALTEIIVSYDRPQKLLKYTVMALFSSGLLFPLSFLPRKLANGTLGEAILDTVIPMAISGVLYLAAHWFGFFKDNYGEQFKTDLAELQELKAMAGGEDEF